MPAFQGTCSLSQGMSQSRVMKYIPSVSLAVQQRQDDKRKNLSTSSPRQMGSPGGRSPGQRATRRSGNPAPQAQVLLESDDLGLLKPRNL